MGKKTCEACEIEFNGRGVYCEPCSEFLDDAMNRGVDFEETDDEDEADDYDGGAFGEGRLG